MDLTLSMNLDNEAYVGDCIPEPGDDPDDCDGHEHDVDGTAIGVAFGRVARQVNLGAREGTILDVNGNTVGSWQIR